MAPDMPPKTTQLTRRRKWLFRILASLALPLLGLGMLELSLRMAGYGYPTSFFIPQTIQGQARLVENDRFGWRFFPPAIARSPTPAAMPAIKPAGGYRIFLFGESAALGDPRPAYGAGRCLEALLRERYPGTQFEVVCAAMTAINSHALVPIARECARLQGDLWIIYMGNNEYLGPFGPSTIFGPATMPPALVRPYLALQQTRTGQWLVALARRLGGGGPARADWGGLKMFQQNRIAPGDPRRDRVEEGFRRNLEDMVRAGVGAGVPVILTSMASNLKDCAPFGSLHAPELPAPELAEWERLCQTGLANAQEGNWAGAVKAYQAAAGRSPQHAEVQFRLGQARLNLGESAAAGQCFARARDLDALPFRADANLNRAVKEAAGRQAGRGVYFVDAEQALGAACADQIAGRELFYEHVHLNFEGNYRLARLWADAVKPHLPAGAARRETAAWATPERCAQALGLSGWNRHSILEEIARRLLDAPYTGQFNHQARRQQLARDLAAARQSLQPKALAETRSRFEAELQNRGQDHWLHQNYAEFLEAGGDLAAAAAQWQLVRGLLPHHHVAWFQAGRLLSRLGQYEVARQSLEEALRLRPDLAETHLELGQIQAGQRQWEAALAEYELARKLRPEDPRVCLRRAEVLAAQTKRAEALQCLREAIQLRPSYWEARYLLGVELALDGKLREAQVEFEEVVRLRPDHVRGHFNLGVALARQNLTREAISQFQETLRLEPDHKQAGEYLKALAGPAGSPKP